MAALAEHVVDLARVTGQDLVVTWGVRADNEAGQRFYRRLGARLRTKVVASWQPRDYRDHLRRARA